MTLQFFDGEKFRKERTRILNEWRALSREIKRIKDEHPQFTHLRIPDSTMQTVFEGTYHTNIGQHLEEALDNHGDDEKYATVKVYRAQRFIEHVRAQLPLIEHQAILASAPNTANPLDTLLYERFNEFSLEED